jgi:hypothetical protein
MFWTHWNLSALRSFYGLAASASQTEYISIETVEVAFFVTELKTLQILGVEMSTGDLTESNVRSFEALLTIYLSIITRNI